ncbi:MAG: transglutaminase domain-containing protein [Candidatus Micrarchaeota archaeon]
MEGVRAQPLGKAAQARSCIRPAAVLFAAAFIASAAGAGVYPKMAGSASAEVTLEWTVDLAGQSVSSLEIRSFGFKDYLSQDLLSEETSIPTEVETDDYGNKIRVFRLDPGSDVQRFGMTSRMDVQFPFRYRGELPGERAHYLQSSHYARVTGEIREKALALTSGFEKDLDRLVALTEWVHNNVEYDPSFISSSLNASQVLAGRRGTCDEFSHLLIAMLRSVGIPAKFSASFVYSGEKWGAHAFVEALVDGRWVPVDPTFNEAMLLDATHLKFGDGMDQQDIKEDIVIKSGDADVTKVQLNRNLEVKLANVENFPQLFTISVGAPNYTVGEDSIETISATVKNGEHTLAVPLSLNAPRELTVLGAEKTNHDRLILLRPYEERTVLWKVKVGRLEDRLVYSYPIEVSSLGQNATASLRAAKNGERTERQELEVVALTSEVLGPWLNVVATIRNSGNLPAPDIRLVLAIEGYSEEQRSSLQPGEVKTVSFRVVNPGGSIIHANLTMESDGKSSYEPIVIPLEEPSPEPTSADGSGDGAGAAAAPDYGGWILAAAAILVFLYAASKMVTVNFSE